MSLVTRFAALLCAAASACTAAPPPPAAGLVPPPLVRPPAEATYNQVLANPDAARVLAGLHARGLGFTPSDVSRVDLLAGSPGYAWRVGAEGGLHIHVYRDRPSAAAAARRFADTATSRTQIIDWAGQPHLFHCGTALALYLGETPQALNVLTDRCGPPVWKS